MSEAAADSPPVDPPIRRAGSRVLDVDGERWIAWVAGAGAGGTGSQSRAFLVSVLFATEDDPETPRREALLPRGRFENLYGEELLSLFRGAALLPPAEPRS